MRMPAAARRLRVFVAALAFLGLDAACTGVPARLVVLSPAHGAFVNAPSVVVTGRIEGPLGQVADVTVNGVSVLPLAPDGAFSATVALDHAAIFNPILVVLTKTSTALDRERITVIAGEGVADGGLSPMGIAMRLDDRGLNQLESQVTGLVSLDPAGLLPPGTQVIDNYCAIDSIFGCLGRVDAYIANPPPSITSTAIDIDALANDRVAGDVTIGSLRVYLSIIGVSGIAPSCGLRIDSASTRIDGDYALRPFAADRSYVDVSQSGLVDVAFSGFSHTFTSGICDFPLLGDLIGLIVGGSIRPAVESGFRNFLNAVDANGNTPVAGAIETALAGIHIAGPIGQAIGVNLEAPLYDVYEDANGITLDADARVTASAPHPDAVDLAGSYHVSEPFPTFGGATPAGALPYDLALAISSSAFNQLLKAETESGLLLTSITQLDLGNGPEPLTAGLLGQFVPAFRVLDPSQPARIDLIPTLAPLVNGQPGPSGELAELRMSSTIARVVVGTQTRLEMQIDSRVGLDLAFANGALAFEVGALDAANLQVAILYNPLGANETQLENLMLLLVPDLFPSILSSLGSFPLPSFFGLQLGLVEAGRQGSYLSLFLDLL
jgi:hypothetical protein